MSWDASYRPVPPHVARVCRCAQAQRTSLKTEDMKLEVPDPIVAVPALQVLPMATFI